MGGDHVLATCAELFTPLRGRVRPHQGHKVFAPGKIFTPNSSKNLVFSAIFVPLEENMLVFTMFLQHQGQN